MRTIAARLPVANLVWLDEVDSTILVAERIMAGWEAEDDEERLGSTVLVAGAQTAGKGRGHNTWASPRGGLYATWLSWLSTASLAWLPVASGECLAAALEKLVPGLRVGMKWPNDLQVEGRKLGGILCSSRIAGDQAWAVVSFGVNLAVTPRLPAGDPVTPVALGTLGWSGDEVEAGWALVDSFLRGISPALAEPEATRGRWEARSVHRRGDAMRVRLGTEVVTGTFAGFGAEGHLRLDVGGELRVFSAGELLA